MYCRFLTPFSLLLLTSWPVQAEELDAQRVQEQEMRWVARKLVLENSELRQRVQQMEELTRTLFAQEAITRTEAKLVEKRSQEVQQQAESSGLTLLTADEQKLQRELLGAVRALRQAEMDRNRLQEQTQRLIAVMQEATPGLASRDAALQAKWSAEIEAGSRLIQALAEEKKGTIGKVESGTLHQAKIQQTNEDLHLVVLNIGTEQGVRIGMPFVIRQGEQAIALVRAVDVRDQIAGALIERVEKNFKPQTGDIATVAVE